MALVLVALVVIVVSLVFFEFGGERVAATII